MEKVCVLGAGSTKYGRLDDSISDITIQASVDAIESAGIEPKEIKAGTFQTCLVLQTNKYTWDL